MTSAKVEAARAEAEAEAAALKKDRLIGQFQAKAREVEYLGRALVGDSDLADAKDRLEAEVSAS